MHQTGAIHKIVLDILCENFACDHKKLCGFRVVESHEDEWGPVTLLVTVGEVLEVEPVWGIVQNVAQAVTVSWILKSQNYLMYTNITGIHENIVHVYGWENAVGE